MQIALYCIVMSDSLIGGHTLERSETTIYDESKTYLAHLRIVLSFPEFSPAM